MATETVSVTTYDSQEGLAELNAKDLNLEQFVRNATWKDLLMDLVAAEKLDPWDIDIAKVTESYISLYSQMKTMDLHIPANIILAAAVLLRMKSDSIPIFEIENFSDPITEEIASVARVIPVVAPLTQKIRIQPGKRITLMELMQALDDAIKLKERRETLFDGDQHPMMNWSIPQEDINEQMETTYGLLGTLVDKEGLTTFSEMAKKVSSRDLIVTDLFIPLLFLAHKERVVMVQERFFDEIFIKITPGKVDGGPTA